MGWAFCDVLLVALTPLDDLLESLELFPEELLPEALLPEELLPLSDLLALVVDLLAAATIIPMATVTTINNRLGMEKDVCVIF